MRISNKLKMKHPIPNTLEEVEQEAINQLFRYSTDQEFNPEFLDDSVHVTKNNWRLLSNNYE
jgi:hypothetical protein